MNYEVVIPVMISFAISAVLGPVVIPFLRRLKIGQTERKELESHLKKNGGNGLAYLLENFVPRCIECGVKEEDIKTILSENFERILKR